jgi:rod shape determining protein RodA
MRDSIWRHFDFWLLGAVAILTIFGITMIRSAIAGNIDLVDHAQRQLIFAVAGFAILFGVAAIDYRYWSSVSNVMYIGTAVALVVLNVVATAVFGSARWFNFLLINIQPSEIAKIVMILVLADFFARHYHQMGEVRWIIRSFLMAMGIIIWVVLQPNLSTAIVMLVIWFALLWAAGLRLKHLLLFSILGLLILAISLPFLIQLEVIQPYQVSRVTDFLFPDEEARYGATYNVQQALISIGSGGLFGQGYGHGSQVQLRFLKVRHSDFIFSAMAEEFGLIGTTLIMLVLLFVILRCLRAARLSMDTFGALICYGVATLLSFQAVVNIGVNLNMIPVTGLTLPFISYGGSSLVTNLIGIGLVESVILRHKALEFSG